MEINLKRLPSSSTHNTGHLEQNQTITKIHNAFKQQMLSEC